MSDARPLALRFTNQGHARLHVYLVGEKRDWLLGRVEAGMTTWLAVPVRTLASDAGTMRIAVLAGAPPTLRAEREARTVASMAETVASLLTRRWTFTQGQLVSLLPDRQH
jgi:hypothetical protein